MKNCVFVFFLFLIQFFVFDGWVRFYYVDKMI